MNGRSKLRMNLLRLAVGLGCAFSFSSCVIYGHRERVVRITNRDTGKPVGEVRFRFTHAVPAVHLPKTPEPIDVLLGPNGEAKVRFPVVMGWARVNGASALLHPENIREGGSFELEKQPTVRSERFKTTMVLEIEKPHHP
ncbi:hypothetical protein DES53_101473 [Roseimicrobium gellanilyticum]|uniref:Lipoprotein n=2 Tax=Roseimicrobium gellanilyticum TaxID=748857 RepID=A0A366HW09_9BACT|nr:hypothetical protein DES53_101473 [Roseimicrobium gellanilyticum]